MHHPCPPPPSFTSHPHHTTSYHSASHHHPHHITSHHIPNQINPSSTQSPFPSLPSPSLLTAPPPGSSLPPLPLPLLNRRKQPAPTPSSRTTTTTNFIRPHHEGGIVRPDGLCPPPQHGGSALRILCLLGWLDGCWLVVKGGKGGGEDEGGCRPDLQAWRVFHA